MASSRRSRGKTGRTALLVHIVGLGGLACILLAVLGLVLGQHTGGVAPPHIEAVALPASQALEAVALPASQVPGVPEIEQVATTAYYPLEVGRYWVYEYEDGQEGITAEVVRSIERRERQGEHDLFIFADGTIAYFQEGRIYEMGPEGGYNEIPVEPKPDQAPVYYRSKGMQIEKRLGALDTTVILGGRRFDACLEVITRFRSLDSGAHKTLAYSSYFARGIGLVGRQRWPKTEGGDLTLVLADHGVKGL